MDDCIVLSKAQTTENFINEIESLVKNYDLDWIDAIVHYCNKNKLEIESVASLVKSNAKIKSMVQLQAEKLNYLPKVNRLPL